VELLLALIPPAAVLLVVAPLIRRIVATWRAAAERLGYEYVPGALGTLGRIVGRTPHGRVEVSLAAGETMLVEIDGGRLPYDLVLLRRGLMPRIGEIETGDIHFDTRVSLLGTMTTAIAALPMVVRMRLSRLAESARMSVRDGRLTVSCNRPRAVQDVVEVIEDAVDLFKRMSWTGPVDERLLENFENERDPHVRERLFKLLLHEASEVIRQRAIRRAVEDLNPEVRLSAVKALKSGGWEEAVALYRDRKVVSRYRADALRHLALTFGRERALPLVEEGLANKSSEICGMAVEAIGGWRHAAAIGKLEALQAREPAVVERVASALGRIGGLEAQRLLIDLLRSEQRGVRQAAIDALGRAGTIDAIPVLSRIKDFGLKASVREAIGAIQVRCGREAEGALSLSPESAQHGAVSLSGDTGAVSMAERSGREK
jgi:hypothetical protein